MSWGLKEHTVTKSILQLINKPRFTYAKSQRQAKGFLQRHAHCLVQRGTLSLVIRATSPHPSCPLRDREGCALKTKVKPSPSTCTELTKLVQILRKTGWFEQGGAGLSLHSPLPLSQAMHLFQSFVPYL